LIEEILNALNNRMMVGSIFCDLQKAFDCVNHNIFLTKLEFCGITGSSLKLIKSYLEGRYQRVILNNRSADSCSNWGEIKHRVPQGSVLGPLLFLIYKTINDNAEIVLLVYNTSIIITGLNSMNFESSVSKVFQDINRWFTTNLLSLNVDKTQFMQFITKTSSLIDLNIMHGNKEIVNICNAKFLGLTLETHFPRRLI
jgi:hypothetical protein